MSGLRATLRARDGELLPFEPERWSADAGADEGALLDQLRGPVLDVGCGPGRLVTALMLRGVTAMGVDPAPGAVALARERGAPVLERGVWDRLPGEGRWGAVLLFDGNVGIGGDPVGLLTRCRQLLAPDGDLLIEVEGPDAPTRRLDVRIERGTDATPWFPWATLGVGALADVATPAGFEVARVLHTTGDAAMRWFAFLSPAEAAGSAEVAAAGATA